MRFTTLLIPIVVLTLPLLPLPIPYAEEEEYIYVTSVVVSPSTVEAGSNVSVTPYLLILEDFVEEEGYLEVPCVVSTPLGNFTTLSARPVVVHIPRNYSSEYMEVVAYCNNSVGVALVHVIPRPPAPRVVPLGNGSYVVSIPGWLILEVLAPGTENPVVYNGSPTESVVITPYPGERRVYLLRIRPLNGSRVYDYVFAFTAPEEFHQITPFYWEHTVTPPPVRNDVKPTYSLIPITVTITKHLYEDTEHSIDTLLAVLTVIEGVIIVILVCILTRKR